jgi:signal transduction histidine kinase
MYVLILMTVYSILTFVLFKTGGMFYHILPFGTILFALIVLISVNEQIRKATLRENFIRDNIQKASAALSQVLNLNKAISLIFRTINLIYPNNFFILYTYHPYGNYFLLKKAEGISLHTNFRKITIDRNTIKQIIRSRSPLSKNKFEKIWPDDSVKGSNSIVFPLVKKNDLLGMAIISIESDTQPINTKTIISLRFLFLQLTNTLSNIRMLNDMQDQQKLVAIGAFSSSIIHNLKNPIDGMRMIIEVLRNEMQENDPKEEYIKELYEGILKLKQDLMTSFDFVKYKEGKKDKFNINELIHKISTDFKKLNYPDISINLGKDINEIEGDKEQLYYAIENLVENALEASINSEPVQVSTRLNKSPKTVEIEIKDFGKGIPVEKLDKLFEIFYTTRGKGRGLGLTITRNIISSHNGYIDVNSQINKGTTFTVVLPLSQEQNNK